MDSLGDRHGRKTRVEDDSNVSGQRNWTRLGNKCPEEGDSLAKECRWGHIQVIAMIPME